jgi:hypothetical protein
MACQEQKLFMNRHLGLPREQTATAFLSRIQQFNRYVPNLPGRGNKFDTDDVREMVYNALLTYLHPIFMLSDYKLYNKSKSDAEVCAYFIAYL